MSAELALSAALVALGVAYVMGLKRTAKPGAVVVWPFAIGGERVSIVRQACGGPS
jgi:hypothetical protein